jgi:hypothetical protein
MFGKKKVAADPKPQKSAIEYINKAIDTMSKSDNYDMVYGMLCFATDFEFINFKERQELADKLREKANELRKAERAQK